VNSAGRISLRGGILITRKRQWDVGAWYLYLLECVDGALYTGIAIDPLARYEKHRAGKGAKYTRANRPVRLIGAIAYPDRGSATRAEIAFKKLKAAEKRARIGDFAAVTAG